jgi:hypothetical protein
MLQDNRKTYLRNLRVSLSPWFIQLKTNPASGIANRAIVLIDWQLATIVSLYKP